MTYEVMQKCETSLDDVSLKKISVKSIDYQDKLMYFEAYLRAEITDIGNRKRHFGISSELQYSFENHELKICNIQQVDTTHYPCFPGVDFCMGYHYAKYGNRLFRDTLKIAEQLAIKADDIEKRQADLNTDMGI